MWSEDAGEWQGRRGQFGPELEWLALNEVYVGEGDVSRASVLSCSADKYNNGAPVRLKCSGLLVCTGTGSTAWAAEVNKVRHHHVRAVLRGLDASGLFRLPPPDTKQEREALVRRVAEGANEILSQQALPPHATWLQLLVREPIMPGDVSDYLVDRLPRVSHAHSSAQRRGEANGVAAGRGTEGGIHGGVGGVGRGGGEEDGAMEPEADPRDGRPLIDRVGKSLSLARARPSSPCAMLM